MTTHPPTTWRPCATGPRAVICLIAALLLLLPSLTALASPSRGGTVYLQTVPALGGVRLDVGGAQVTTGSGGEAQVSVADLNHVAQRVTLAGTKVDQRTSVALSRVSPAPHAAAHVSRLSVGLRVTSLVRLRVDPGTSGVSATDVRGLRLHSLAGQVITEKAGAEVGLLSRRAVLRHGVLSTQDVTWSVDRVVTTDKASVTTSSPRFDPFRNDVWTVRLAPVAGTITVHTVPRTADVAMTIGMTTLTTGSDGSATAQVPDVNEVRSRLRLLTAQAGAARVQIEHVGTLRPQAPHERRLLVALEVARPVTFTFVDPAGDTISPGRVDELRLNQDGQIITLHRADLSSPVLLPSARAGQVRGSWQTRDLDYALSAVRVDGANAVFSGKQRLDPARSATWRVRLSVYDLSVIVRDSLLGRTVDSAVTVTLPDGQHRSVRVGAGSPTHVAALARGLYQVDVAAAVIGGQRSLLVSQDTDADLRVITLFDVLIVLVSLTALAAVLVLTGRRLAAHTGSHRMEEDLP